MMKYILHLSLLVSVVCVTSGQSTRTDNSGCVYTFNVPASDCRQPHAASVDDQILKNTVLALQEQVMQLASDNRKLANDMENLKNERPKSGAGTTNQHSSTGGAVYTRWGRKTCPGNDTDLLYSGVVAGSHYTHSGGGSNYLCVPRDPEWGPKTTADFQSEGRLYGAEYQMYPNNPFSNGQSLDNNDVPCAVCLVTSRLTKLMIPAKLTCPDGWTKEYSGYLMAEAYSHKGRTTFVCMDNAPEVVQGGSPNRNGALFYNTEARCGSLPCPNYATGNYVRHLYQITIQCNRTESNLQS